MKLIVFTSQFRFATTRELFLTIAGVTLSALAALLMPLYMVLYGELTAMFYDRIDYPGRTATKTYLLPVFGGGQIL